MSSPTVDWPWQYSFPPFFTVQPHLETRKKQVEAWCRLVLQYQRASGSYVMDVREASASPLFTNQSIGRSLSAEGIGLVLEALARTGNAEPVDKSKTSWYIYWYTLDKWASLLYRWAQDNALVGTVCTLYEITNNEEKTEFRGIHEQVLLKALRILENSDKAEIIAIDDDKGVKFF